MEESMGQTLEDMLTPQSLETVRSELGERVKAFLAGDPAAVTRVHELEMTRKKAPPVRTETMTTFVTSRSAGSWRKDCGRARWSCGSPSRTPPLE